MESSPPESRSPKPAPQHSWGRWSVHGDIWTRYLQWAARHTPPEMEFIHVAVYSLGFFLACGPQRRAVAHNLRALRPDDSPLRRWFGALQVFWNFAWTAVDTLQSASDPRRIEWEIEGEDHFQSLRDWKGGAVILTAHMGSYDLAGPVFAPRFGRTLHAVRAPERTPELQVLRERELAEMRSGEFGIHYNQPGNMLGVTLARALAQGEFVAIQADRMLFEIAGLDTEWRGWSVTLPKGPFILAQSSGCPLFPVFILRLGRRRYRVRVEAPLLPARRRENRDALVAELASGWMERLGALLPSFWRQWFVFEPVFRAPTDAR